MKEYSSFIEMRTLLIKDLLDIILTSFVSSITQEEYVYPLKEEISIKN